MGSCSEVIKWTDMSGTPTNESSDKILAKLSRMALDSPLRLAGWPELNWSQCHVHGDAWVTIKPKNSIFAYGTALSGLKWQVIFTKTLQDALDMNPMIFQ